MTAPFDSRFAPRTARWQAAACGAHEPSAEGGMGHASRAGQRRVAAPHGVPLATAGQEGEPRSTLLDRDLLLFVRARRAAQFAALSAPRTRAPPGRARPVSTNLELCHHDSRPCL